MYRVTLYESINDTKGITIHYPNNSETKLTSGNIAKGINVVDSFTFSMNFNNPGYLKVQSLKSLVTVYNTKTRKVEFDGYVLNQSGVYDEDGSYHKTIVCVSGLNYLKKTMQVFREFRNTTPKDFLQAVINVHNSQVEPYKQFKLGTVNVTNSTDNVYRFTDQEMNTFETIFDKLIERLGGEIKAQRVDGQWQLDWMQTIGEIKQTEIRVGKNLKSASRDENTETVYTRWMIYGTTLDYKKGVIDAFDYLGDGTRVAVVEIEDEDESIPIKVSLLPSGATVGSYIFVAGESPNFIVELRSENEEPSEVAKPRLTIGSVNGGKDYIDDPIGIAQFGIQVGHVTFDDVTNKSTLKNKGQSHVNAYRQVTISNVVNALDLSLIGLDIDSYEVYNSYPLNNPGLAAKENVRIIEKRIDINNPQSTTLTIGDKYQKASQYQANTNRNQKTIKDLRNTVANQTTSIITLRNSNKEINKKYTEIEASYNKVVSTLEIDTNTGTSLALQNLKRAIEDLGNAIPIYGPATETKDGLMTSLDKVKLDSLEKYQLATGTKEGLLSKEDKQKLNRITANQTINLDQFMADFLALKQTVEDMTAAE